MNKTPPYGLRKQSNTIDMIAERIGALEADAKDTGERLAKVEAKQDIAIDLLTEMRREASEARTQQALVLAETQKTERVRVTSRAKIVVGIAAALATGLGALMATLAGCGQ